MAQSQLQQFLLGTRRAPRSRTSLILVDQVITTLAACVTTFSELDTFAEALQSESDLNLLDRLRWVSKESELKAILMRIESHKGSLNLMLMILTCQKQEEAEDKVDHLCHLVQKVLESNTILAQRLGALEETPPEMPNQTVVETVTTGTPRASQDLNVSEPGDPQIPRSGTWTRNKKGFAFEELLMNSRASAGRTGSWSMLSGLSLSETSHIGILAIPIYETDITNKEAYDFNPPTIEPSSLIPDIGPISKHTNKTSRRQWLMGLVRGDRPQQQRVQTDHETKQPTRVFGIPIHQSITYACATISLVDETGKKDIIGTDVEDIFALNGNPARVMQLQTAFETPPLYGMDLKWDGYTVHDAAALLQRYLKILPEPIIPYAMYDDFVNNILGPTLEAEDLTNTISTAQQLITALPPLNRQHLLYILDILAVITGKSEINKMTSERLTAAFQPAILSAPPAKMDTEAHSNAARVVVFLIHNQDHFIISNPPN
ncbi:Rho GTPase activation protein [Ustulina deusta]|nr:Rho GTPase activation protein [Ustulina deusta]